MANRLMHIVYLYNREKHLNPESNHREPIGYEYQFRRGWNPAMGEKYNAKVHYRDASCSFTEVSHNLNRKMPLDYIQVTWELSKKGVAEARRLASYGLSKRTLPHYDGPNMVFCFGTSRDGHIKAVFSYEPITIASLGIKTNITSLAQAIKFEKYFGRDIAPHISDVHGVIEDLKDDVYKVTLNNGTKVDIALRPKTVLNDGVHPFSERGAMILAGIEDPKPGQGFGFTSECGDFVKGHGVVVPWLKYDAVFHDRKELMHFGNQFWFGRLRDLHVGRPYLDIQTIINMMADKGLDLLMGQVDHANRTMLQDVQDFTKLRERFLARLADREEGEVTWTVERAAAMKIDPIFPALFRSITKTEKRELEDMPQGRIPFYNKGVYRYVCPELHLWAPDGHQDKSLGRLKGNCAFTTDLKGKAAMWRQPNGTMNERHVLDLVSAGAFADYGQGSMLYLGADIIEEVCLKLGTMDFDDAVILTTDADFVRVLESLPAYPAASYTANQEAEIFSDVNPYDSEIRILNDPTQWSIHWFDQRVEQELDNKGVGYIANALMLDNLVSVGRDSMLDDLADMIENEEDDALRVDLVRRYKNLEAREPFVLKQIGNRYNDWIDLLKTGKEVTEAKEGYEAIEAMYKDLAQNMAFPWLWTVGGFAGKGRVPAALQKDHQIVYARTPLCRTLQATKRTLSQVDDVLIKLEWGLVRPLPAELQAQYPADEMTKTFVSDLRKWWYAAWDEARQNGNVESVDPEAFKAAYTRIEDELNDILRANEQVDLRNVAVELASRIYKNRYAQPVRDEQGRLFHFRDRLLWAGDLGHAFLDAIEGSDLSGIHERVYLDRKFRKLSRGNRIVQVVAQQGVTSLKSDGRVIGVANVPDGDWAMQYGMILVRDSSPLLQV